MEQQGVHIEIKFKEKFILRNSIHYMNRFLPPPKKKKMIGWVGLGCRIKAYCPLMGSGPAGGVPSVKVFLRDLSPHLHKFWRKSQETPNGYAHKHIRE